MAGIIVSGGVYSGSGDVTTQFFKTTGTAWNVALPDGTLELYGESGSWTMINNWPGSSDYWNHNEGTVKVTQPNSTILYAIGVNPSKGHLYNLEIDQGVDGRGVDGVQLSSNQPGSGHLVIKNNLTITSGTTKHSTTAGNNNNLVEVSGHCTVGVSGNMIFGDASFMNSGYNQTSYGNINLGSLQVNDGGNFSASSGSTTISSLSATPGHSGLPSAIEVKSGGTFTHSSGTVLLSSAYDQDLEFDGTGNMYNLTVNKSDNDVIHNSNLTMEGNLDVTLASVHAFRPSAGSKTLTVSGNFEFNEGKFGAITPYTGALSFGSLKVAGGEFNATSDTTTITGPANGDYLWRSNAATFHHNSGTVYITTGAYNGTDIYPASAQHFYNLILSGTGTVEMYSSKIANNYTLGTNVVFRPITPTQAFTISGTATMNGFFGKDGYPQTNVTNNNFGTLTINSGGTYYATSGATNITSGDFAHKTGGTFTHNNGKVVMAAASGDVGGSSTGTVFYDLESTSYVDVVKSIAVENTMKATGSNSWRFVTNQTVTMGTATSSGRIEVGTASAKGMRFTNLNKTYKFEAANEAHPWVGISSGAGWNNQETGNTIELKGCDMQFDFNTQGSKTEANYEPVTWKVENAKFDAVTINTEDQMIAASGHRVTFGGTVTIPASGMIVSGALVNMEGAGNWSETGYQPYIGRATATLMWNSTGYYSPNGGYLNNGWKDVFWNSDARINQDGPFRNSNLIVGKTFNASNRPIGSTVDAQKLKSIRVATGGLLSSSTNLFRIQNAGTFSTRGGFFASSSAFYGDNDHYIQSDAAVTISSNKATYEGWFKATDNGYLFTHYGSSYGFYSRFDGGNLNFYFKGPNDGVFTDVAGLMDSNWHHIAIAIDNTDYKLYIDGELLQHKTAGAYGNPNAVFRVGGVTNYWDGAIANARIFQDARTNTEIRNNMFAETPTGDNLVLNYVFNEGYGTVINDSANSNDGKIYGVTLGTAEASWAPAGNWNGNTLSGTSHTGKLYIGTGADPTIFNDSTFELSNRMLVSGSKMASKAHKGTTEYYIATSGTNDYLNYQKLDTTAPIGVHSDLKILATGTKRSYFSFDSNANNEQCNTLVNAGVIRIVSNADFYTQDFDNAQGQWVKPSGYDGQIHDDGSTPNEYEPIDIMDDIDSTIDVAEPID